MDQYISESFTKWFTNNNSFLEDDCNYAFNQSKPFSHLVFKDLFQESILEYALYSFKNDKIPWRIKECSTSIKHSFSNLFLLPERHFYCQFFSPAWLQFLERISGIDNLIPDPYFFGGGFHNIPPGGFLKTHVDFNRHDKWGFDRRLNVLIFLNKNWDLSWGGELCLGENSEVKIPPLFNTTVIFETSDKSWHGHPEPLRCPEGESRKSIALYYYTATNLYKKSHTTIYK